PHSGRDDDGSAVRLPARRLDRRRGGVQLARNGAPARRCGGHARLSGDPGTRAALLARIRAHQPHRRRALCGDQADDSLPMNDRTETEPADAAAPIAALETTAVRTPWTEFWRKFRKQQIAVVAGWFVALLVLLAFAAPWLAPYDAENFFDYDSLNALPSLKH